MLETKKYVLGLFNTLYARNMLAAADGNISYRVSDDEILITPSGMDKSKLTVNDFAVINIAGDTLKGHPSSEKLLHLQVYQQSSDARCVIHAHPPTAIAWTIAKPELTELSGNALSEVILALGKIPIAPYARPGTDDLANSIKPCLPDHKAIILARHGAITWGTHPREALNGMERIEHVAEILMRAQLIGNITELPQEEIDYLQAKRKEIGNITL